MQQRGRTPTNQQVEQYLGQQYAKALQDQAVNNYRDAEEDIRQSLDALDRFNRMNLSVALKQGLKRKQQQKGMSSIFS